MVIPDARLDSRFRENPVVTGPPHVRFYAGVALVSPEGYKLGDFCVWDTTPRPNGLTAEEKETLRDMANMTVKVMVDRRYQLEKKKEEDEKRKQLQHDEQLKVQAIGQGQGVSVTAQDMMSPLSGLQLSLSLLKEDEQVKSSLGEQHRELINAAANSANMVVRMCRDVMLGMQATQAPTAGGALTTDTVQSVTPASNNVKETKIGDLVKSLRVITAPMDTDAPLMISAEKSFPAVVMMDELKIFRSALNLLESAIERTREGMISLSIRAANGRIVFECADTGQNIPTDVRTTLFLPSNDFPTMCGYVPAKSSCAEIQPSCKGNVDDIGGGLAMVAALVDSIDGGEYGYRPSGVGPSGSLFWFSIPLELPNAISSSGAAISDSDDGITSRKRHHSSV